MNKKHTSLKEFKLDECEVLESRMSSQQSKDAQSKATRKRLVDMDELKETFCGLVMETVEEYAKHIPEPSVICPIVQVQCDGKACKSIQNDVGTIKTDITTINSKAKSIDESLKTISNDLGKRPCLKCVPKELSGFYFRGHHIRTGYIFGAFTWFILTLTIVTIDSCKQQSVAETNMELAIRWHAAYVECNHKHEQLVKEVKDCLPKKATSKSSKRK